MQKIEMEFPRLDIFVGDGVDFAEAEQIADQSIMAYIDRDIENIGKENTNAEMLEDFVQRYLEEHGVHVAEIIAYDNMNQFKIDELTDYFCNEIMAQWGRGFDENDIIYADIKYKDASGRNSHRKYRMTISEDRENIKKQIAKHCNNIWEAERICFDDITSISLVCDSIY